MSHIDITSSAVLFTDEEIQDESQGSRALFLCTSPLLGRACVVRASSIPEGQHHDHEGALPARDSRPRRAEPWPFRVQDV